ncbi:hypothetical protein Tco_0466084 [Tanacetum coccineum]
MEQRDSAAGSGHGVEIELVTTVEDTTTENVAVERPRRQRKRRPAVGDASGSSHPPKKLKENHMTSSGIVIGGKSPSVLKELLSSSILNAEVGATAVATLSFITSSISATLEHEGGNPTNSVVGPNVCTVGLAQRFVISLDYSHHSTTNASGAEFDAVIRSVVLPPLVSEAMITSHAVSAPSISVPQAETKITSLIHPTIFHGSGSTKIVRPDVAGPSFSIKQDLSMGSRGLNIETLHQVFVPQWNVLNNSLLDDSDVSREFIDHLAPPVLFSQIRKMDYHHLFTEFNMGTARQACLSAEVKMRTEYCLSERRRLESECEKKSDLLKAKDNEIENLKAQLLLKEAEAAEAARLRIQRNVALEDEKDSLNGKITELQSSVSAKDLALKDFDVTVSSLKSQNDGLVDQVHALETTCSSLRDQVSGYEHLKEQIEEFQDAQMNIVTEKLVKLDADLLEMALHLKEKFYRHLLTTISGRRWLLTHGLKLAVVKCLNSPEYLTALGAAISRAIEKGMQSGLSAGIDHGKEERSLTDVAAYNPAAEADFNSALQRLREVDYPLLAELKSHKDASVEDIMNLLRLEGPLANAPGMSDLQSDIDHLMLPIHRSKDQVVLGETSLSFALCVTHSRVERIRENVAAQRSALIDVWAPLVDPLSADNLMGAAGTSGSVPTTIATTIALSTTFVSTRSIPPITVDDYEITGTDDQEGV